MLSIPAPLNRWTEQRPAQLAAMALDRLPAWVSILAVLLLGYYLAGAAMLSLAGLAMSRETKDVERF